MTSSTDRVRVAAVALVDDLSRPTRVLAARRSAPPALAGGWEFPGGKVEPGESPAQAAVRETLEELGVRVRLGERVGGAWPLGGTAEMLLWWAEPLPGEPAPSPVQDHDELRWLGAATLDDVPWLVHDLPVVDHLRPLLADGPQGRS
ncbi:(deoxy)nucleoside triphosphate pyrophosphohydrolase [Ornithinimicrobium avium]|uniref:8-oxo-dGTP diphosphatase n=1 Tax=Ornithinimicrobium avium TaxID=2283195 RepID=A0A345NRH2_9MICO|nr:(deoxy)nucleoside triphosphate pyrophosphohydrolase [Ornithinimicrobium avium]AXH97630.1 (deoxy)nucleoside triphosphate pyrophosphohydrolase [Ornithinimicrobium avium]